MCALFETVTEYFKTETSKTRDTPLLFKVYIEDLRAKNFSAMLSKAKVIEQELIGQHISVLSFLVVNALRR